VSTLNTRLSASGFTHASGTKREGGVRTRQTSVSAQSKLQSSLHSAVPVSCIHACLHTCMRACESVTEGRLTYPPIGPRSISCFTHQRICSRGSPVRNQLAPFVSSSSGTASRRTGVHSDDDVECRGERGERAAPPSSSSSPSAAGDRYLASDDFC
jgi:hypothetical protein